MDVRLSIFSICAIERNELTNLLFTQFDAKAMEDHYSSDSEDVDESLTVPKPLEDDVCSLALFLTW